MTDKQPALKKRHGTENRQRQKITPIRWEQAEFNKVSAKATRASRLRRIHAIPARMATGRLLQRILPVKKALLLHYQGQHGRLTNNVNQIARRIRRGRSDFTTRRASPCLKDYPAIRDAIFPLL
jgi:hypothetical protein